jgi:hypothetical protein
MKKKKWLVSIITTLLILLTAAFIFLKLQPFAKLDFFKEIKSDNIVSKTICSYRLKIGGDSMVPILENGKTYVFNKCFDEKNIEDNTVILYDDNKVPRTGIIRYTQNYGRLVYKVSNEREAQNIQDVLPTDIYAIYITDISNTNYTEQSTKEVNTDFSEYMDDFYLASLDIDLGIESGKLKEDDEFDLDTEKFCYVAKPNKSLTDIDVIVFDDEDNEIFQLVTDGMITKKDTNCISKGENGFDLDNNQYILKVFVENILIKESLFKAI